MTNGFQLYLYSQPSYSDTEKFDERYGKKTGLANKPEFHEERFEELIEEIKKHENMAFFCALVDNKRSIVAGKPV